MATVYLNIGLPKTGTTALQTFLRENEALLAQNGYLFPHLKIGIGPRYANRNGHFLVYRSEDPDRAAAKAKAAAIRKKAFDALRKISDAYPNIILSDEAIWKIAAQDRDFWPDTTAAFEKIGCRLRIVVYLRRQDLFVQSLWNQNIKSSSVKWTQSFDECIKNNGFSYFPLDYYKQLTRIARYINRSDILIRVYEQEQLTGEDHCLYADFLQCIGLTLTDAYTQDQVKSNLGLRGNFIEIKRILNSIPEYREMGNFMNIPIRQASSCVYPDALHADTSMFSYEDQVRFLEKYSDGNRKIAEEFLGRPDGRLFYDPVEKCEKWNVNPDSMYRDILIFFTEVLCGQQEEILKLKEQRLTLRLIRKIYRKVKKLFFKISDQTYDKEHN